MSDHGERDADLARLEAWAPHDEARSRAQIDGVLRLLGAGSRRVLDLGCGGGRVLVPLVRAGHEVTGVDRDDAALDECRRRLGAEAARVVLRAGDVTAAEAWPDGAYDAVLCLGNTFMTISDVDAAVDLMRRARAVLAADGAFVVDDVPLDCWGELTEGNWLSGVSDDERMQLVWHETDAVFALRVGAAVDPECWHLRRDDGRLRLWTDGSLRLAARAAGLSAPVRHENEHLLSMRSAPAVAETGLVRRD